MRLSILHTIFLLACAQVQLVFGAATPSSKRAPAHQSELISFPASQVFLSNAANVVKPLSNILLNGHSNAAVYYGVQIEDPTVGWLFLDGISLNIQNPTIQAAFNALLANNGITTQHINFPATNALPAIFTAGETELTRVTLKSGTSLAQVTPLLDQLSAGIRSAQGGVDSVYGTNVVENSGTLELVAGWDSVTAHTAAISDPALLNIIIQLLALVDIIPANVVFHKVL